MPKKNVYLNVEIYGVSSLMTFSFSQHPLHQMYNNYIYVKSKTNVVDDMKRSHSQTTFKHIIIYVIFIRESNIHNAEYKLP